MSVKGSAESYIKMRGSLRFPAAIVGKSAYEEAVENGFDGTLAEWLASLKGEKPVRGVDYYTEDDVLAIVDAVVSRLRPSKIGYVTLKAGEWAGDASPYSQVVEVAGATENSQVDLTPSVEQLAVFYEKDLTLVTENDDGVVTVYAIGQKPTNDYTIQVTITEVEV